MAIDCRNKYQSMLRFQKSLQSAAYFLQLAGGRMKYLRLLKLLYLADRESLSNEEDSITGDRVSALPHGPVLSTVYNLIKHKDSQSELWHKYVKTGEDFYVFLAENPGTGDLYRYEKEIIERVHKEHENKNDFELVDFTHDLPEWKKYERRLNVRGKKSYSISLEDILEGVGKPELIERVRGNLLCEKHYNELFGNEP